MCLFSRYTLCLTIFSTFHTTGLSLDRDVPIEVGTPYLEAIKYNVTVVQFQTAYLPCVVKHLGDKTVSWIRKKDLHILSFGSQIYTNDKRFSLLREGKLLNAWTLKIASVAKKDEGAYECQVNTDPKLTVTIHLIVLGPLDDHEDDGALALGMLDSPYHEKEGRKFSGYEAKILGPSLMELEQGHLANFTCIISHASPRPIANSPPNVTWFHNEVPMNKEKGGFSFATEKSSFTTVSRLVILNVDKEDEGKYSCGGVTIYPDSVVLRIRSSHNSHSADLGWKNDYKSSAPYTLIPINIPYFFTMTIMFIFSYE